MGEVGKVLSVSNVIGPARKKSQPGPDFLAKRRGLKNTTAQKSENRKEYDECRIGEVFVGFA